MYTLMEYLMTLYNKKMLLVLCLIFSITLSLAETNLRWKAMNFDNPGSKRLLKTETGKYFFYRSLPEKSMLINVEQTTTIEIRAISKIKISKPVFYLKYADKKTAYDLKFTSDIPDYQIYEPVRINLPPGVKQLELLCYDRNLYFRAFEPIQIQKKKISVPVLKINSYLSSVHLTNHKTDKVYYSLDSTKSLSFQVKKGLSCSLFLRAKITDKKTPEIAIYKNGVLLDKHLLSTKRTSTYKVDGFNHLSIGKKIELPATDITSVYEIRAVSNHLFIAKPTINKK